MDQAVSRRRPNPIRGMHVQRGPGTQKTPPPNQNLHTRAVLPHLQYGAIWRPRHEGGWKWKPHTHSRDRPSAREQTLAGHSQRVASTLPRDPSNSTSLCSVTTTTKRTRDRFPPVHTFTVRTFPPDHLEETRWAHRTLLSWGWVTARPGTEVCRLPEPRIPVSMETD